MRTPWTSKSYEIGAEHSVIRHWKEFKIISQSFKSQTQRVKTQGEDNHLQAKEKDLRRNNTATPWSLTSSIQNYEEINLYLNHSLIPTPPNKQKSEMFLAKMQVPFFFLLVLPMVVCLLYFQWWFFLAKPVCLVSLKFQKGHHRDWVCFGLNWLHSKYVGMWFCLHFSCVTKS